MSKLKTGDFFHVKDATAADRKNKYGVVIHSGRKIFFFINSRKKKKGDKSYARYDKKWNCSNILKDKYTFLRDPVHCISCKRYYFYDSHDINTGKRQNIVTEKFECSLDLSDLVSLRSRVEGIGYEKEEFKKIILASIDNRIQQIIAEVDIVFGSMPVRDNFASHYDRLAYFLYRYIFWNDLPAAKQASA